MATILNHKLGAKGNEAYWNAAGDALLGPDGAEVMQFVDVGGPGAGVNVEV